VSFVISAFVLLMLKRPSNKVTPATSIQTTESQAMKRRNTFIKDISLAFTLLRRHQTLFVAIISLGVVNFAWSTVFMIGMPLLVKNNFHQGIGLYGLLTGAYGIGNVINLLVTGGVRLRRSVRIMFLGQIILGIGFLLLSTASIIPLAILGTIVAAFGSPMGDLVLLNTIQSDFPPQHVGKVYSFRFFVGNLGLSLGLLISVALYKVLPVSTVMLLASISIVVVGIVGIMMKTVIYPTKLRLS
jgi:MFS transporter, DHA3 family, macrolide efflux protein